MTLRPDGYRPCHNADKVIAQLAYDAQSDLENTPDSVFCAHGAGVNISWDRVAEYMHLESVLKPRRTEGAVQPAVRRSISIDERELEAIMEREFGAIKRPMYSKPQNASVPERQISIQSRKEYIIVDGYNLIFAWDELKSLAKDRLDLARTHLMDMLVNYCGYTKSVLVLVFDGFRTPGNPGSKGEYHNIKVVYTKDGETGDAYIERIANDAGRNYSVRVVTNDNLIRLSALRSGVLRCSAGEFKNEVEWVLSRIDEVLEKSNLGAHSTKLKDGKQ